MKSRVLVLGMPLLIAVVLSVAMAGGRPNGEPIILKPSDLIWEERPTGVKVAVLQGDPDKKGPFTLRLQYPPGFSKAPHYHPGDAFITVLSGSYFRGYGNSFDRSKAVKLTPGVFSVNPSGVAHYEWADSEALIQVHATGPWTSVYVDETGRPVEGSAD